MMAAGLRNRGALVPIKQAVAITIDELQNLLMTPGMSKELKIGVSLSWSTASRWDDIFQIEGSSIILGTPQEIIIAWGSGTKVSRGDFLTRVRIRWSNDSSNWQYGNIKGPSTTANSQQQIVKITTPGNPFTGDSFKRVAANRLVHLAAQGVVDSTASPTPEAQDVARFQQYHAEVRVRSYLPGSSAPHRGCNQTSVEKTQPTKASTQDDLALRLEALAKAQWPLNNDDG